MDASQEEKVVGVESGGSECACCGPAAAEPASPACFDESEPCCGPPPGPPASPMERPGYRLWHFVEGFAETEAGPVPRVKTRLEGSDHLGTVSVRLGGVRENYRVAPGLYCAGQAGPDSEVLVTANYKLSFDALRRELGGLDVWILVLDTRGINVWCAAGKKIFGTDELVRQVNAVGLEKRVSHRRLILPQLGATGVSAPEVKKRCGFRVVWGPIQARDLKPFLEADMNAGPAMRRVTFTTAERTVLVPVEISYMKKPVLIALLLIFLLSGIGPQIFSLGAAWSRGLLGGLALAAGILAGAVVTPVLLPWLPGTAFSRKGTLLGVAAGLAVVVVSWGRVGALGALALLLFTTVMSSYLAMNFTGSTTYTSPTGVEKEMRRAIPLQAGALVLAVIAWVASAFTG
jgi:hypothetical protein